MKCSDYLKEGLIKNKWGIELFQISQKERLFHLLWQPTSLETNLAMCPPSCILLQLDQEDNIPGHATETRAYGFGLKISRMVPIPTSRIGW